MKNNLIVFDIDGTLTQSVGSYSQIFEETLVEIGLSSEGQNFETFKHLTDAYILKEIYNRTTGKSISEQIKSDFEERLTERNKHEQYIEIPGARAFIEQLQGIGFVYSFATGSSYRPALHKLITSEIPHSEELLVGADHIEERENLVLASIEKAKKYYQIKEFDRIISIGDGIWDLRTANNLNIEFIGIGKRNKSELLENNAEVVFDDFTCFDLSYLHK